MISGGVFKGPVRELRLMSGDSKVISSPSLSGKTSGSSVRFSGERDGEANYPVWSDFKPFTRFLPYLVPAIVDPSLVSKKDLL